MLASCRLQRRAASVEVHSKFASYSLAPSELTASIVFARSKKMPIYIIDDVYGDQRPGSGGTKPVYSPAKGQWDPSTGNGNCMNGTWHTVTVNPGEPMTTVSIAFTGSLKASDPRT